MKRNKKKKRGKGKCMIFLGVWILDINPTFAGCGFTRIYIVERAAQHPSGRRWGRTIYWSEHVWNCYFEICLIDT